MMAVFDQEFLAISQQPCAAWHMHVPESCVVQAGLEFCRVALMMAPGWHVLQVR
jgi:hypothetical protein